jgi:uncharacterized protein (TIGR03083 family)
VDRFLVSLQTDAERIADVLRAGPLDAPVAACPGWDLADLGRHLGSIHRWVLAALEHGRAPEASEIAPPPGDADDLAGWLADGAARLAGTLGAMDPAAPTWHPFTVARVVAVWPRRQAHETMVHRWDAERAVGAETPLDPALALDGLLEWAEVIVPRVVTRDGRRAPAGVLVVHATDVGAAHRITSDGRDVRVEAIDVATTGAGDPVLRGRAEDLLLAVWHRRSLPAGTAVPTGAGEWLAFGGN